MLPENIALSLPKVRKYECLLYVKAQCNDFLGVLDRQPLGLLQFEVLPQELLVVRQLDHQGHVERVLQPPVLKGHPLEVD